MSTLSLRLPDSLHRHLKELASRDGISINQFIATAVAEKRAALMTADYLQTLAQRGERVKYDAALSQVPDIEPEEHDRL